MTARSILYCLARFLGDVETLRRGPTAVLKRQARKALLRTAGRAVNSLVPPSKRRRE